ncbi:BTAD domain-containing putative transcriptional regulator [Nonomuraea sp. NPDC050310]|uniref:BTAD domain-containing putative transcriptional regulator n=1 Tax=Nonomuraea sp. NPDC050310 TaxID=3154935 RepID=UPI0033C8C5F7
MAELPQDPAPRFGILGPTRAWGPDGAAVPVGGPAARALLALLLSRFGRPVPPEVLIDELYGEAAPPGAAHALQSQVSRLRKALPGTTIETVPGGYRLAVSADEVDAGRFEGLAEQGARALRAGEHRAAAALLRQALALWRGPALADAPDSAVASPLATRLTELRLAALEDRIEADLRAGEHPVAELRELVAGHPLRERLHALLIRALAAEGRPAAALEAYEQVRRLLVAELGTDPGPELAELHLALLRAERPRPSGPPAQLTSFVGRDADLDAVARLLSQARLVTLLGPGGAGKTRLAVEAVTRAAAEVCFVELAPLREPDELPMALFTALGLRERGLGGVTEAPVDRLVHALAERPDTLLALDNCEHLVGAVAELVARLLAGCPELRILATSREPLGLTGEHLWPVGALAPEAAVRLFHDRASAVRPGFTADPEEVGRLCAALDRLPLAIELAAARARTHELPHLAARLSDRFGLLSRGSRTAEPRHQTLRAVVAWSWDLLDEQERATARRLTVFAGGATAEAAQAVCGGSDEVLDSLADKSFVEVTGGRYRMLETIRAFCAERLAEAGETEAARRAHAEHFLAEARQSDPPLRGPEQLRVLARLAAEHDNLLAALHRLTEAGRTEQAVRLLGALAPYLWMRGMRAAVAGPATVLLDRLGADPDPGLGDDYVLVALTAAASAEGRAAWLRHRPAAERLVRRRDPAARRALVSLAWPMINSGEGDPAVVLAVLDQAHDGGDAWEQGIFHFVRGYPAMAERDWDAAEREFRRSLAVLREVGDRWGCTLALDALAGLAALRRDWDRAVELTDEAITLAEELGADEDLADLLCSRGDYLARGGRPGARRDYLRAAETARRAGSPTLDAAALRGLADLAREAGRLGEADELYTRALERFDPHWIRNVSNRVSALIGKGLVTAARGDLAGARAVLVQAVEAATAAGTLPESARAAEALAGLALTGGDPALAARLLGGATTLRGLDTEPAPEVAATAAAAQAALGPARYGEARAEGLRLTPAEALRLLGADPRVIDRRRAGEVVVRER